MLCLTRKLGESIDIGEGEHAARVTVIRVNGKVTLGIEAAPHVVVVRSEISEDKERGKCAA